MFVTNQIIKDLFARDKNGKSVNLKGYSVKNVNIGFKKTASAQDLQKALESEGFKVLAGSLIGKFI